MVLRSLKNLTIGAHFKMTVVEEIMEPAEKVFEKCVELANLAFSTKTLIDFTTMSDKEMRETASIGIDAADRKVLAERIAALSRELDTALTSVRRNVEGLLAPEDTWVPPEEDPVLKLKKNNS